MRFIVDMKAK